VTGTAGEITTVFHDPAIGDVICPAPSSEPGWPLRLEYKPTYTAFAALLLSRYTLILAAEPVADAVAMNASAWPELLLSKVAPIDATPMSWVCAKPNPIANTWERSSNTAFFMTCSFTYS
jgi:hypothetical protein